MNPVTEILRTAVMKLKNCHANRVGANSDKCPTLKKIRI